MNSTRASSSATFARSVKCGEHFTVSPSWFDALTAIERSALSDLAEVRTANSETVVLQAKRNRAGRFCVGGYEFSLLHSIPLRSIIAMSLYVDSGTVDRYIFDDAHSANLTNADHSVADLIAALLAGEAARIARAHLYAHYDPTSSVEQTLRGSVDWSRSLGRPAALGLHCVYFERTMDVLENRIVTAALVRLRTWHLHSDAVRRLVAEQSYLWQGVCASVDIDRVALDQIDGRRNRLNAHYATALGISKLVLTETRGLGGASGTDLLQSIWLDVPSTFERFVVELLRRATISLSIQVEAQPTNKTALLDADGKTYRRVRPDVVLRRQGKAVAVVDMKAKPQYAPTTDDGEPKTKVTTSDIFQLLFYAQEAQKSAGGLSVPAFIVAPALGPTTQLARRYRQVRWRSPELDSEASLRVCAVDVDAVLSALASGEGEWSIVQAVLPHLARTITDRSPSAAMQ